MWSLRLPIACCAALTAAATGMTPGTALAWRAPGPERPLAFALAAPEEVTPMSAEAARFPVLAAAKSARETGDLAGAADRLAQDGRRLKDPALLVEASEGFFEQARTARDVEAIDDARRQARVALDMLYFLQSDAGSGAWQPVAADALPGLITRASTLLDDSDTLLAEIEAEIAAANAPPPPVDEKPTRPGLGLMIVGGVAVAVGAAGAGLGAAGLALGAKNQALVEDPLVYEDEHRAAEVAGANANMMAWIGFPVAAVGLAVGVALLVVGKKKRDAAAGGDEARASLLLHPTFGREQTGLSLTGRF